MYFVVGGRRLRFSKYEFCLLSGLKFEGGAYFPAYNNDIVEGGVLQKYWPNGKVDLVSLQMIAKCNIFAARGSNEDDIGVVRGEIFVWC